MNELAQIRKLIDAADDRIIAALNERFELAKRMRAFKKAHGLPPVDAQREREIYEKVLAATDPAERDTAFGIYERILRGSRGFVETIARGVAVRDGKVLLCRAKGGQSTYLPRGHIEFGEPGREALVREVKEELGTAKSTSSTDSTSRATPPKARKIGSPSSGAPSPNCRRRTFFPGRWATC